MTRQIVLSLICLAGISSSTHAADLVAETYGRPSGDIGFLAPVLELVDAGTPDARLVLTGGQLGHPASIVVSSAPSEGPVLVADARLVLHGQFDWRGQFEVMVSDLPSIPVGVSVYAQGMHFGVLPGSDGVPLQRSQGLQLSAAAPAVSGTGWVDMFEAALPSLVSLRNCSSLAELLQRALNSPGDSVRISGQLGILAGWGVGAADASAGPQQGIDCTVTRTQDGIYELTLAADLDALIQGSVGEGAGATAGVSGGRGVTAIYRFHSAPGAARGIHGLLMGPWIPILHDGSSLNERLSSTVEEHAEVLSDIESMQAEVRRLEQNLLEVLEVEVRASAEEHDRASSAHRRAMAEKGSGSRPQRARSMKRVVSTRAQLAAATTRLRAAEMAASRGREALEAARTLLNANRQELRKIVDIMARMARVRASLPLTKAYAASHLAGFEQRMNSAAEAVAYANTPGLELKNLGAFAARSAGVEYIVRIEGLRAGESRRASIVRVLELDDSAGAGSGRAGFEVARTRTLEHTLTLGQGGRLEQSLSLSRDTSAFLCGGVGIVLESGRGRTSSIELGRSVEGLDLGTLLDPAKLNGNPAGSISASLAVQDRIQSNVDLGLGAEFNGIGFGLDVEVEWSDMGPERLHETTLQGALQSITQTASTVFDVRRGAVVEVR